VQPVEGLRSRPVDPGTGRDGTNRKFVRGVLVSLYRPACSASGHRRIEKNPSKVAESTIFNLSSFHTNIHCSAQLENGVKPTRDSATKTDLPHFGFHGAPRILGSFVHLSTCARSHQPNASQPRVHGGCLLEPRELEELHGSVRQYARTQTSPSYGDRGLDDEWAP
jgi:hypothetical protein